jgi:hypothetical protein
MDCGAELLGGDAECGADDGAGCRLRQSYDVSADALDDLRMVGQSMASRALRSILSNAPLR